MKRLAVIYLAHLNPMTDAHKNIISLLEKNYNVYVFPMRFLKDGKEINTRSFPFSYEIRKSMVDSVFRDNARVITLPDYTFFSPFIKYLPPLISPYSWLLRNQIIKNIREDKFVAYTGDHIERLFLKIYGFHPLVARRFEISASTVKDMLYRQASERKKWQVEELLHYKIPEKVVYLIKDNWMIIEKFAQSSDLTIRIMGMKFPKEGFF